MYSEYKKFWRTEHNLANFTQQFPLAYGSLGNPLRYTIPNTDAVIRFLPGVRIFNGYPDVRLKAWAGGHWRNFSILVEPVVVKDNYGAELLGASYTRAGVSGRITNSFIRYKSDIFDIQFGRGPVWWGQSWESSIIQSGQFPAYDHFSSKINLGQFQLEILSGQLSSEYIPGAPATRIKRYIAGHRLCWLSPGKKYYLNFGEQIIYTGENRSLELLYLNPTIPYFFTALEGDETNDPDNDNSIIFFSGRFVTAAELSPYFEFIIDDFQVDQNTTPHALGYKLGVDGPLNIISRKMTFLLEYTRIDSWTYIHHGQFTSWQNRGHAIGYKYGPDCRSVAGQIDYQLNMNWQFSAQMTWLQKGANSLNTVWDATGTRGAASPTAPVSSFTFSELVVTYFRQHALFQAGYSNYPLAAAEIDGAVAKPAGSIFLRTQLIWDFGFNLDGPQ